MAKTSKKNNDNKFDILGDLKSDCMEILKKTIQNPADSAPINYWCSTGCSLLDWAIGHGIPGGRVIELYGAESSCKTGLALSIVRQAQSQGGMGIWMDNEGGFSEDLCDNVVGVDRNAGWIYRRPYTAEETLDSIASVVDRVTKSESQLPVVIVVDSVAGMCAQVQTEGTLQDKSRTTGSLAMLLSWFGSRKTFKQIIGHNIYIIFINQTRASFDFHRRYGPPPDPTTTGGAALRYYADVRISLSKVEDPKVDTKDDNKNRTGILVRARVTKCKVNSPDKEVRFPFYFREDQPIRGIDDPMAILTYLISRNVMTSKAGGWYTIGNIQDRKLGWRKRMLEDPETYKAIWNTAKTAFMAEHGIAEEE